MSIIYKKDLYDHKESTILTQDDSETTNIINAISDFIETSTENLCGSAWDDERNRLNNYKELMNIRKKTSQVLDNGIKLSKQRMNNYMEEDDVLDDSKLEEISQSIAKAKNQIADLNSQIEDNNKMAYTFKSIITFKTRYYLSIADSLRNSLQQYESTLQLLEAKKEKLQNLKLNDLESFKFVEQTSSIIQTYKQNINNINV